jgi:mRNA interferase RelE/StbE
MEKLVFEDLPACDETPGMIDIKKIQSYSGYYRIRIGEYRIGCEIQKENTIIFYRVKHRKDIYRIFP